MIIDPPDVIDTEIWLAVGQALRGNLPTTKRGFILLWNLIGYGGNVLIPEDGVMTAKKPVKPMSKKKLADLCDEMATGKMHAAEAFPWQLLLPILLQILQNLPWFKK